MIALSNFNAKMNSLKEVKYPKTINLKLTSLFQLAKIIENSTSNIQSISKASIKRDVISEWIIENSILSKALEGKHSFDFIY
jgi:hypothetical protein